VMSRWRVAPDKISTGPSLGIAGIACAFRFGRPRMMVSQRLSEKFFAGRVEGFDDAVGEKDERVAWG